MEFEFEWHDAKSTSNERKHGVSFAEAETVFGDWFALTEYDPDHSYDEDRLLTVSLSPMGRLLIVSHTDRSEKNSGH